MKRLTLTLLTTTLLAMATPALALEMTLAEAQRAEDVADLTNTLTCEDWRSPEMLESRLKRLGAHRVAVNSSDADSLYLAGQSANIDYTFPTGLRIAGLSVIGVSIRQEHTTPDQYQYLSYQTVFSPDSAEQLVSRFGINKAPTDASTGERRGWFNQHDFKVRADRGVNTLTCGYFVRTPERSLTQVARATTAWIGGVFK